MGRRTCILREANLGRSRIARSDRRASRKDELVEKNRSSVDLEYLDR